MLDDLKTSGKRFWRVRGTNGQYLITRLLKYFEDNKSMHPYGDIVPDDEWSVWVTELIVICGLFYDAFSSLACIASNLMTNDRFEWRKLSLQLQFYSYSYSYSYS
jgi:hypothetical protein